MPLLSSIYTQIQVDRSQIDQPLLDIEKKTRSNPLKWNGQFSPQLIGVLLDHYARAGDVVLDPFLGSGTLFSEAGRKQLRAFGTEINPAAVILSRLYTLMNMPYQARKLLIRDLSAALDRAFPISLVAATTDFHDVDELCARLREIGDLIDQEPSRIVFEALVVWLDLDMAPLTTERLFQCWRRLTDLVLGLPFSEEPVTVLHADARDIPLKPSSVDLIVTSPPYINVLNYHQQYRASVEFLGWDPLMIARSEIGSNRKNRGNRFLTAIQYCLDMALTLQELQRICRPDARLILVVGRQSAILGVPFFNGEIVTEIAHHVLGMNLLLRQERVFRNRFGTDIFEDILHFSSGRTPAGDVLNLARHVAEQVLQNAFSSAPETARPHLAQALEKVALIEPSPLLVVDRSRREQPT